VPGSFSADFLVFEAAAADLSLGLCSLPGLTRGLVVEPEKTAMKPHTFHPLVESLDARDIPGTSWGPPWVFGLASFLVSSHLLKLPRIKLPKAITAATIPTTALRRAIVSPVVSEATPVSGLGAIGGTVGSDVSTSLIGQERRIHLPPRKFRALARHMETANPVPALPTSSPTPTAAAVPEPTVDPRDSVFRERRA
jgi:hypothetical protein